MRQSSRGFEVLHRLHAGEPAATLAAEYHVSPQAIIRLQRMADLVVARALSARRPPP